MFVHFVIPIFDSFNFFLSAEESYIVSFYFEFV